MWDVHQAFIVSHLQLSEIGQALAGQPGEVVSDQVPENYKTFQKWFNMCTLILLE